MSWFEAAAVMKDGLRAYTALHTLARMAAGQTLLVLDGASVSISSNCLLVFINNSVVKSCLESSLCSISIFSWTSYIGCMQPFGVLVIQLAHFHGVKVMATALSAEDQKMLEELRPSVGEHSSDLLLRGMQSLFWIRFKSGFVN